jgi:hypothetical protein
MNNETKKPQKKKIKKTHKKMKIIGTETYTNASTGEIKEMQVISIEDRDFNFDKIWIVHILEALDKVGNQKIKVMNTLLRLKNRDNQIIATQRDIAKESAVSLPTVSETIRLLLDVNFLVKQANGVYMINPDVIFKGNKNNRMDVLLQYKKYDAEEDEIEVKIDEDPDTYLITKKETEEAEVIEEKKSNSVLDIFKK